MLCLPTGAVEKQQPGEEKQKSTNTSEWAEQSKDKKSLLRDRAMAAVPSDLGAI